VWLIPTRNRPGLMVEMIAAMRATGDIPICAVMQDACEYAIDWPAHWHIHRSERHLEMSGALNALFKAHPGEPFYGMLDDHTRPLSPGWDAAMREWAGEWQIASFENNKNRVNPRTGKTRINCYALGGKLARALGWVWPNFVIHLWGDDALEDIGYELGILRHVPEARAETLLLRDGTLPADINSRRIWSGMSYPAHDEKAYRRWKNSEFRPLCQKLRWLMADYMPQTSPDAA